MLASLVLTFLFSWGCGNPVAHVPEFSIDGSRSKSIYGASGQSSYIMVPGDVINIKFTYHPEQDLKAATTIRPDGNITLEGIGSIQAAGLTPEQLAKMIAEKTSTRLRDPEVIVTISQYAPRKVYVAGEVKTPGVVLIQDREGMTLTPLQAIFDRGGFTSTAQVDSVILIRGAASGEPKIGRLDIKKAMEDAVPEQVALLPNDVIYVPMTGIARADLWVQQHIKDVIPFELFYSSYYFRALR
jgi:protein involved in polysaccharide export with SLBB domain